MMRLFLILVVAIAGIHPAHAQVDLEEAEERVIVAPRPPKDGPASVKSEMSAEALLAERPQLFKGYGRYRASFMTICPLIEADGHSARFEEIIRGASERDPECPSWRPFALSLTLGCKKARPSASSRRGRPPAADAGEVPPTPTPRPIIRRTLPHPVLIDEVSRLMSAIAEDELRARPSVCSLKKLLFLLRFLKEDPPVVRGYFDVLAEYFEIPMKGVVASISSEDSGESKGGAKPQVNVDSLFEE